MAVAAAAPAMAASGDIPPDISLVPDSLTVGYADGRPDRLAVSIGLLNSGTLAAEGITVQASLGPEFGPALALGTDSGSAAEIAGSGTGNEQEGWVVTFPAIAGWPGPYASTFEGSISLTETTGAPYRGLRGSGGWVVLIVEYPGNSFTSTVRVPVPGMDVVTFDPGGFTAYATFDTDVMTLRGEGLIVTGDHGIGQVTLQVTIPKKSGEVEITEAPPVTHVAPGWTYVSTTTSDDELSWTLEFTTDQEGFAGAWSPAGETAVEDRGPGTFQAIATVPEGYGGTSPYFVFTADGLDRTAVGGEQSAAG